MSWLYAPTERAALVDVAKLAVVLRGGRVPAEFSDGGVAIELGQVGRVTLLAPADLDLPSSSPRRFVLARGTLALCLAEVIDRVAGDDEATALLDALAIVARQHPERRVIGWLIAPALVPAAVARLASAGAVCSTLKAGS